MEKPWHFGISTRLSKRAAFMFMCYTQSHDSIGIYPLSIPDKFFSVQIKIYALILSIQSSFSELSSPAFEP